MLRRLLALVGGAVVAVVGIEIGLRVLGISYPSWYGIDPHSAVGLRAHAEGWFRYEGEAWVAINSDGLRDHERPIAKPQGELRIAVLGDSYTMASQVAREEAFVSVLEDGLGGCAALDGRSVDALNFGVTGFGTAQELQVLRHRAWKYDPDWVLLAFLSGNDLADNSRAIARDALRPYFDLVDGELVLDDSFRETPAYRRRTSWIWRAGYGLIDVSRTLQLLNELKNQWRHRREIRERYAEAESDLVEAGLYHQVYAPPQDEVWREAWALTEALVAQMNREVVARGASFAVVTLTNAAQLHPDAERRAHFRDILDVDDLGYADRRVQALGEREGFPVLVLAPRLVSHVERTGDYVHGFENKALGKGHWNALGHRLAGEHMAEFLCRQITARQEGGR